MSTTAIIKYGTAKAYYIPSNALIMNNIGQIGIKYIEKENTENIKFAVTEVISQEDAGYWIKQDAYNTKGDKISLPSSLILIKDGAYYVKSE